MSLCRERSKKCKNYARDSRSKRGILDVMLVQGVMKRALFNCFTRTSFDTCCNHDIRAIFIYSSAIVGIAMHSNPASEFEIEMARNDFITSFIILVSRLVNKL